jgi:putative glycerol-1-phosphate prenyltransferase
MLNRSGIYETIAASRRKQFAVLVDPDKYDDRAAVETAKAASRASVDIILAGGSLMTGDRIAACIRLIKDNTDIPVVIFPGSIYQVQGPADALLLLSLISGRNPDLLIGKHVVAAPFLKQSGMEIIPTGYMLIDGGRITTAHYISNTLPIPSDKDDIAVNTAMAGEMLGLKLIYLDAGSGATQPVTASMIRRVKENITIPLLVGGGIRSPGQAAISCRAGADMVVVGNALENGHALIARIADAIHSL